jgi:antitoxin HicB
MPTSRSGKPYSQSDGRSFDQYLEDEGLREELDIAAEKMYIAYQLEQARIAQKISKSALAQRLGTSRAQIDRVLDQHSQNVTIETLKRVAAVLGKQLKLELI